MKKGSEKERDRRRSSLVANWLAHEKLYLASQITKEDNMRGLLMRATSPSGIKDGSELEAVERCMPRKPRDPGVPRNGLEPRPLGELNEVGPMPERVGICREDVRGGTMGDGDRKFVLLSSGSSNWRVNVGAVNEACLSVDVSGRPEETGLSVFDLKYAARRPGVEGSRRSNGLEVDSS